MEAVVIGFVKKAIAYILLTAALAAGVRAQGSVLQAGRWWKLTTDATGMYRLRCSEVPGLEGASVDSIGVYGSGGRMLSEYNSRTSTGDLEPLAVDVVDHNGNGRFDAGDEVLFYGEGADVWCYNTSSGRWEMERHAYAPHNHYFVTRDASAPRRIATAAPVAGGTTVTTYTSVTVVDNDLVNLYGTGQKWMGEMFSSSVPTRTFTLQVAGNADGVLKVRYGLASKSTAAAQFSVSAAGYSNQVGISSATVYSTTRDEVTTAANGLTFTLTYSGHENTATGYLDYIEMSAHAPLAFGSGQRVLRNDQSLNGAAHFVMSGATGPVRVWEVTKAGCEREMALTGGSWGDSTTEARTYVAFDGSSYLTPSAVEPVVNQNLHGCEAVDLVVVSHKALLDEARRVATLHELFDGLNTLTVTDMEVYNEYSSGKQDPLALRSLLRDMKARHGQAPRYLLIMGSGTYDNRHLNGGDATTVAVYETPYSYDDDGQSYCSDDIVGYLSATGRGASTEEMEVSTGRLPAKNVGEAHQMVDKIESYLTRRDLLEEGERGDWRNYVALLADDADPGHPFDSAFAHSSEVVAKSINTLYPQLNIDKLYADSYHQSSGAIGSYYPDLNNALRQRMNNGCLLMNYIGHGSTTYIGTERYIELSDIDGYSNTGRWPLLVTSTCSYGRFDRPETMSGAEAFLLAEGGAIGVVSASRPISHVERFNNDVVRYALDPANSIGDALRLAKNRTAVAQCIGLTGDPALRLSQPENRVVVTEINARAVAEGVDDTATVLSRVTVKGEIQDSNGVLLEDFDGTLYPIVFDREMWSRTLANDNPGTEVNFTQQKNILYKGSHPVSGGRFEYSFIVPQDVAYQYGYAKLSHYAKSASDHATGCYRQLLLGGLNDTATLGTTAPTISLYMGDTNFRDGGLTDASPTLLAMLSDSAGINAGAGLGHDITAVLDGNPGSLVVLNDLYEPDVEQAGHGSVRYTFADLPAGRHTLTLKAWNIFNLSAEATISFTVCHPDTLTLSALSCYPNPASGRTQFMLEVNNASRVSAARLEIYNSYGRLVASQQPAVSADGYTVGPTAWDVSAVPPGLYMARMIVTDTDGHTYQQTTKCVVR